MLPPLLADALDILIAAIPIIASLIYWIVQQSFGEQAPQRKKPPLEPQKPVANVERPVAPPRPQPNQAQRDEVEEFIRKAQQRREQQQRPQPPRPQPAVPDAAQKAAREPSREPSRRERQRQQKAESRRAMEADQRQARELRERRSVAQHVSQAIDTSDVTERIGQFGAGVQAEVTEMAEHLSETFGGQVGRLAQSTAPSPPPVATTAPPADAVAPGAQLAALLADPNFIRQAFILQEILQPPTQRWRPS